MQGLRVHDEMTWAWVTVALSAMVALAYVVIAFNWYFRCKITRKGSAAALARLGAIFCIAAICGCVFYTMEASWAVWRVYDLVLLLLACHTWHFAVRMKGMSLVDQRLAQAEELEKSSQKYREIAELLPHMVWTATDDGRIDYSNQKWAMYVGDGRTWIEAVHADERHDVAEWWAQAVASRQPASREVRLCGVAGCRTFLVNANPIARGDVTRWLGACADIEDQKLLADQKDQQTRQKLFFLNSLSHDLRSPLNIVALNAQLLQMSIKDHEARESVDTILENAVAAGDLVTKLLDFARLGTHEANQITRVAVAALLNQIARRFQPLAEQKGLYFRLDANVDAEIQTDRVKLERVISNLVDNALKYTPSGGIELSVKRTPDGLSLLVSDTGMGIPAQSVPHLFDEFYQVNNHERDSRKGFGLGLAICGHLVRQLGGNVRLAGTGRQGSCFEVALKGDGAAGGGRQGRPPGDLADSESQGLCRV
jgi:PAS domain S-box-containing protein